MQFNSPAKKVGTVTLAIDGVAATLTVDTAREWGIDPIITEEEENELDGQQE